MGFMHRVKVMLGLADDYDEYDDEYDDEEYTSPVAPPAPEYPEVTPIRRAMPRASVQPELRRITTVHPRSYNDARVIKWIWSQVRNGFQGGAKSFGD